MSPNPGSPEAVEAGCTCPVMDNHYGRGAAYRGGGDVAYVVTFWYSEGCPVHGPKDPDHKPDGSGLDDGPWLPGKGPRTKPAPKSNEELATIRAKAWATRRGGTP